MKRAAPLLLLCGCVLEPLQWQEVGVYYLTFDHCFDVSKGVLENMGYPIEEENREKGEIVTEWRIHKTGAAGQGQRSFVRVRLYTVEGGFVQIFVMGVRQKNENPSGPTSNPEMAHWGIEENDPTVESWAKLRLQYQLKKEKRD
jgi:hypothetical protein